MSCTRPVRVVALVLIPLFAACDAGDTGDTGADAGPGSDPAARSAAPSAPPETEVELAAVDHSGITGAVGADRDDEQVTVSVSVEGLEPGVDYPAHVHDGRCVAGGPVRFPLGRITADDDGTGRSTTRIPAAELPAAGSLFVQVHGEGGRAVACADLPAGGGEAAMTAPAAADSGGE